MTREVSRTLSALVRHLTPRERRKDAVLAPGATIDAALIDAIRTSAFVEPRFQAVAARLTAGEVVLLGPIDVSPAMRSCWDAIRDDPRIAASVEFDRVGIGELRH